MVSSSKNRCMYVCLKQLSKHKYMRHVNFEPCVFFTKMLTRYIILPWLTGSEIGGLCLLAFAQVEGSLTFAKHLSVKNKNVLRT